MDHAFILRPLKPRFSFFLSLHHPYKRWGTIYSFYLHLFNSVAKKKLFLCRKNIGAAFYPSCNPQVTSMLKDIFPVFKCLHVTSRYIVFSTYICHLRVSLPISYAKLFSMFLSVLHGVPEDGRQDKCCIVYTNNLYIYIYICVCVCVCVCMYSVHR